MRFPLRLDPPPLDPPPSYVSGPTIELPHLSELLSEIQRLNARIEQFDQGHDSLDAIALALHPEWEGSIRRPYYADYFPGMIGALHAEIEKLEVELRDERRRGSALEEERDRARECLAKSQVELNGLRGKIKEARRFAECAGVSVREEPPCFVCETRPSGPSSWDPTDPELDVKICLVCAGGGDGHPELSIGQIDDAIRARRAGLRGTSVLRVLGWTSW